MLRNPTTKFSSAVRARAERMSVWDHEGGACLALGGGLVDRRQDRLHGQTLHEWVKKAERDSGVRAGKPHGCGDKAEGSGTREPRASAGQ